MNKIIKIENSNIRTKKTRIGDFVCLSDISIGRADYKIHAWINNVSRTIPFLNAWEKINNNDFNSTQLSGNEIFKLVQKRSLTVKKWKQYTNSCGLYSIAGSSGGVWAHIDIALEYAGYIDPRLKLLIIKEFQRLKNAEINKNNSNWNVVRILSRINYPLQTQSIKKYILPNLNISKELEKNVYASEADLINYIVFGMTAQKLRKKYNLSKKDSLIDEIANNLQLYLIANLEAYNSILIKSGKKQKERYKILLNSAKQQYEIFNKNNKKLKYNND